MDKDLSIFANLLNLSGLNTSLAMTDQEHTLFVPTNDAFVDMSIEDFAELTNPKNKTKLIRFVKRHYFPSTIQNNEFMDSQVITQEDDTTIPISTSNNITTIGGATLVAADIKTSNGVIHVLNDVIAVTE